MHLLDGQVHPDTHVVSMGNYVTGVGNYVIVKPLTTGELHDRRHLIGREPLITFVTFGAG